MSNANAQNTVVDIKAPSKIAEVKATVGQKIDGAVNATGGFLKNNWGKLVVGGAAIAAGVYYREEIVSFVEEKVLRRNPGEQEQSLF